LLNSYFVPVYISYDAHDHGDAPAAARKEWQRIYHEANAKLRRSGTVHVYILAPHDAAVIESIDIGTATKPEKLFARLEAVVKKLRTSAGKPVVTPAPQSHPPQAAADALVLHVVARSYKGTWNEFPVESWFALTPGEARKLVPAEAVRPGTSWELDGAVTARFLTSFLPNGFAYASYHKVKVIDQRLRATVVSVEKGVARARLEGRVKLRHQTLNFRVSPPAPAEEFAQMPLVGYLEFDPGRRRVRTLRLLADKARARDGYVEYAVALQSQPELPPPATPSRGTPSTLRASDTSTEGSNVTSCYPPRCPLCRSSRCRALASTARASSTPASASRMAPR
jgi:hypothetical protein